MEFFRGFLGPMNGAGGADPGGRSLFFGRPRFFFPVSGSIGLEPRGIGFPCSSTPRFRGADGTPPSGRGLGGRPRFFFPVTGSIRGGSEPAERPLEPGKPPGPEVPSAPEAGPSPLGRT